LYSFAKKPDISLQVAALSNPSASMFNLPLSIEAFEQFQQVESLLQNLQLSDGKDTWFYIWGNTTFSSRKAYRQLIGTCSVHPVFKWI
jgi:hypothetical protein